MLFGLRESLDMLLAEGLDAVFARHHRLADGVPAVRGLGILCEETDAYSDSLTAVVTPEGLDSKALIAHARDRFDPPLR